MKNGNGLGHKPTLPSWLKSSNDITFRIVFYYAVFAIIWIFGSDLLALAITDNPYFLTLFASTKGTLFVLVTSALLFLQIRNYITRIETEMAKTKANEERLDRTLMATVEILQRICEVRDPYTAGHQRRVSNIAFAIATKMKMSSKDADDIRLAGLVHDVGKMSVPTEILTKPGKLTDAEYALIKEHAKTGYDILTDADMGTNIVNMVHQHHERCDGSGYPEGLDCGDILPGAKILMVADVVEAMASHRPYRSALGMETALAEIEKGAGRLYDIEVAAACLDLFRKDGFSINE